MSNGRMATLNWLDVTGATLASDSADYGDYNVANLLDGDPDLVYRTPQGVTSLTLTGTLDRSRAVDVAALCAHNLTIKATVQIKYYKGTTLLLDVTNKAHRPLYSFGSYPGFGQMAFGGYPIPGDDTDPLWPYADNWQDAAFIADKIEAIVSDSTNPDGYIEIGYLMVSRSFKPGVNFNWGSGMGFDLKPNAVSTPSGATLVKYDRPKRTSETNWGWLNEAEVDRLYQIFLQVQLRNSPVLWTGYPGLGGAKESQNVVLSYLVGLSSPVSENAAKRRGSIKLQEIFYNG